jgi:hypothetical protein
LKDVFGKQTLRLLHASMVAAGYDRPGQPLRMAGRAT